MTAGERGIIFQGWGVRAILGGRKTQTRRVIRNPSRLENLMMAGEAGEWCPYGSPGSILWVRETWRELGSIQQADGSIPKCGLPEQVIYYADDPAAFENGPWRSPIHMPRWASRLTLRLTEVRVQRVAEISEEDARAEGVEPDGGPAVHSWIRPFIRAWDAINGKRPGCSWEDSPWVWALTFAPLPGAGAQRGGKP